MSPSASVASHLIKDPILSKSLNESLARMLRNVHEKQFKAGERIYSADSDATTLYLLKQGEVELVTPIGKRFTLSDGRFGEEAATDVPHYLSDAVALTDASVLTIPRSSLVGLNLYNPSHKAEFYFSLLTNFGVKEIRRTDAKRQAEPTLRREVLDVVGWFASLLLPLVVMLYGPELGLDRATTAFLSIFTATVIMWAFELVDEYIPGLFAVLTTLSLGIAPTRVVLAGFASDGFFMAMSVLGLGAVVVMSGLSFRFLLWLLRYLPNTNVGHNIGLLLTGFLLTPLVPSINGRTSLVTPFMIDMVETVKFEFGGKAATRMAISAFTGVTLLSAAFMTSRSVNMVIFGLLGAQEQQQFQWIYWVVASAGTTLAMLLIYFVSVAWIFRSNEVPRLAKDQVDVQLQLLGNIKNREWAAICGILVFSVGVITTSIHNIQPPWLGMTILYGLLLLGFLRKSEFRQKIDWPSLVYLGSLVGIVGTFNYLGLDKWLGHHLAVLGNMLQSNFGLFVAVLAAVIFVIRLVMPSTATIAICATIFMPIASQVGVNAWVVGFIILLLGDVWIFPYQCSQYTQFQQLTKEKHVYNETTFLRYNLFMNFVRIAGIYASVPYWTALGIL